jgi:hypothetical protein
MKHQGTKGAATAPTIDVDGEGKASDTVSDGVPRACGTRVK